MSTKLDRFFILVDRISLWTGNIASWLLLCTVAIFMYEVIARYFFNAPTIWGTEVIKRLFIPYYFLAGTYILYRRAHIRVDIIIDRLPGKYQLIINLFSLLSLFAICSVMIYYGGAWALDSLMKLEPDNTPFRAPIYPAKLIIPLSFSLLLLQGIAEFARSLKRGDK